MPNTFGFDENSVDRIRDAVRKVEGAPDDELTSFRKQKGVVGEQNLLQWVRCPFGPENRNGPRRYANWVSYDEATNTYTDATDGLCYLRPGPNNEPLFTGRRYLARRQGSHPTDGLPVYVPVNAQYYPRCGLFPTGGVTWPGNPSGYLGYAVGVTNDPTLFPLLATHDTLRLTRTGLYHLEATVVVYYAGEIQPPVVTPNPPDPWHWAGEVVVTCETSASDQLTRVLATVPFTYGDVNSRWPGERVSVSFTIGVEESDIAVLDVRPRLYAEFQNVGTLPFMLSVSLERGSITRIGDY